MDGGDELRESGWFGVGFACSDLVGRAAVDVGEGFEVSFGVTLRDPRRDGCVVVEVWASSGVGDGVGVEFGDFEGVGGFLIPGDGTELAMDSEGESVSASDADL